MLDKINISDKKVSIIIACYNSQSYLSECIDSLKNQTYKNLEIIFVDDGSTDKTNELLKNFCLADSRVKLISTKNNGVAKARQIGLDSATGEYITFYDPDDVLKSDHIENLLTVLLKHGADISVCAFERVKKDKALAFNKVKKEKVLVFDREQAVEQLMSHRIFDVCLWNKLYSADLIEKSGARFLDSRYGEDTYFNFRCFLGAKIVAYTNKITHHYIKRDSGLTREKFSLNKLTVYNNLDQIVNECEKGCEKYSSNARAMRSAYACEMLWFIALAHFKDAVYIKKIIDVMQEDVKHIRKCKKIAVYRRWLIPYVPSAAKIYFYLPLRKLKKAQKLQTKNLKA